MPAYVVTNRDPRRIADAVVRYQVAEPRFRAVLVGGLVLFAVAGGARGSVSAAIYGVVLFAVLVVGVVAYRRGRLTRTLARSGYRPGARLATEFGPDRFTLETAVGSGSYPYGQLSAVRQVRDVVLLRFGEARSVVALPVELVPPGALPDVPA